MQTHLNFGFKILLFFIKKVKKKLKKISLPPSLQIRLGYKKKSFAKLIKAVYF